MFFLSDLSFDVKDPSLDRDFIRYDIRSSVRISEEMFEPDLDFAIERRIVKNETKEMKSESESRPHRSIVECHVLVKSTRDRS